MPVGVVGVERHVEQHADLRHRRLDRPRRPADEVLRVPRLGRLGVLVRAPRCRERARGRGCRAPPPPRPRAPPGRSTAARRRAARRPAPRRPSPSRTKIGQIRLSTDEPQLGHEVADPGRAAQATRPGVREGGDRRHRRPRVSGSAPRGGSGPGLACAARRLKARSRCRRPAIDGGAAAASLGPAPRRRGPGSRALLRIIASASFDSVWYWALHVVVWTLVCYRTLGVPHDMLIRARRDRDRGRARRAPRRPQRRAHRRHRRARRRAARRRCRVSPRRARRPRLPDRPRGRPGGLHDRSPRSPRSPIPSCASRSSCVAAGCSALARAHALAAALLAPDDRRRRHARCRRRRLVACTRHARLTVASWPRSRPAPRRRVPAARGRRSAACSRPRLALGRRP